MKSIAKYMLVAQVLFLTHNLIIAQSSGTSPKSKQIHDFISKADVIAEGRVISSTGFELEGKGIYTSAIIKITKLFRGSASDSVIELVYQGGMVNGILDINVGGKLALSKGNEGIFAASENNTGIKLAKGLKSYIKPIEYIMYIDRKYVGDGNHIASCNGVTYDNLEAEVFEKLEEITGKPRNVFGPNMFEKLTPDAIQFESVNADLIVEGKLLYINHFNSQVANGSFSCAIVRVSRLFKGSIGDSVVQIIINGGNSSQNGPTTTNNLSIDTGHEGIFFLKSNKAEPAGCGGKNSYYFRFGASCFIEYHDEMCGPMGNKYGYYKDLETELYQPLEQYCKTPRKVLGPNIFEQKEAKGNK